jgi:hypothetical protein
MNEGRLIRVGAYQGDPSAVSYVVAVPDMARALELIGRQAAKPGDYVEDLGRVSEALQAAMHLAPGQFVAITGVRHVAEAHSNPDKFKKE